MKEWVALTATWTASGKSRAASQTFHFSILFAFLIAERLNLSCFYYNFAAEKLPIFSFPRNGECFSEARHTPRFPLETPAKRQRSNPVNA